MPLELIIDSFAGGKSVHCLPAECWPDGSVTHAYWCEGCGPVAWSDGDPEMEDDSL